MAKCSSGMSTIQVLFCRLNQLFEAFPTLGCPSGGNDQRLWGLLLSGPLLASPRPYRRHEHTGQQYHRGGFCDRQPA